MTCNTNSSNRSYSTLDVKNVFSDFDEPTQKALLDKEVTFQGCELKLKELLDSCNITYDSLDYNIIEKLIKKEQIILGEEPEPINEVDESCYIPRSFKSHILQRIALTELNKHDAFFISVVDKNQVKLKNYMTYPKIEINDLNIILYQSNGDNSEICKAFDKTCQILLSRNSNTLQNIHFIQQKNDEFVWQCSNRDIKNLQKYIESDTRNKEHELMEKEFRHFPGLQSLQRKSIKSTKSNKELGLSENQYLEESCNRKVNLIVDKPGMGKTTVLKKLAQQLKTNQPTHWVSYFDLNSNKVTNILSKLQADSNINSESAFSNLDKEFLSVKKGLESELFSKTKIILCFDGFDELDAEYADFIVPFVKSLSKNGNIQIYMTSRENMKEKLQNSLCTFASKMMPLNDDEQIDYLKKFFSNIQENTKETAEDITQFATKLFESLLQISQNIKNIMGIPLLIKMLADINKKNFTSYLTTRVLDLKTAFESITDLYREFFQRHMERYIETKEGMNKHHNKFSKKLNKLIKECTEMHELLAVQTLAKKCNIELTTDDKNKVDKYFREEKEIEQYGIISKMDQDNIKFLHITFAEYFVATYVVKLLKINESSGNDRELAIINFGKTLFGEQSETVRKFMDPMLDKINVSQVIPDSVKNLTNPHNIYNAVVEDNPHICRLFINHSQIYQPKPSTSQSTDQIHRTDSRNLCLNCAAWKGNSKSVSMLLDCGAEINSKGVFGMTPLLFAAKYSHSDVISLLLDRGADIKDKDINGWSVLHSAAINGNSNIASLLLDRGADISDKDRGGTTALMFASGKGYSNVVSLLLERGSDISNKDNNGRSALMYAANEGHSDVVSLLLARGADITDKSRTGCTALIHAAHEGHSDVVSLLLHRGAVISDKDNNGRSSLIWAAHEGHRDVVSLLLVPGADINDKCNNGGTALIHAASKGHSDVVSLLLDRGADITDNSRKGWSALMHAGGNGHSDVVSLLLKGGADIHQKNKHNSTALTLAAEHGNVQTVSLLLERGANVHDTDNDGDTVLMCAAYGKNCECIPVLLQHGADKNAVNKEGSTKRHSKNKGNTALHVAVKVGNIAARKLLVENGADVTIKNEDGLTAFELAA